jgi:hypothetical protein
VASQVESAIAAAAVATVHRNHSQGRLNRFLPGFELWQVDLLIMLSYLAAQGLIAFGAIRMAWKR